MSATRFRSHGIEIEYMIVGRERLDVLPHTPLCQDCAADLAAERAAEKTGVRQPRPIKPQ